VSGKRPVPKWRTQLSDLSTSALDLRTDPPNNRVMIRRTATLGFAAIFLATILCAVICPGGAGTHAAKHVCDKPDHSCCPKSPNDATKQRCVGTHFVEASKDHHAALGIAAFAVDRDVAILVPNSMLAVVATVSGMIPARQDMLARYHTLRI
jgi:hypothetical protein